MAKKPSAKSADAIDKVSHEELEKITDSTWSNLKRRKLDKFWTRSSVQRTIVALIKAFA